MDRVLRNRKAILFFLAPAAILYTCVLLIPMIWSIGYSFMRGSPIVGFEFAGLDNYRQLLTDADFQFSFWFGIRYAFFVTIGQVGLGLLLALVYFLVLKKSSALVRTIVFIPMILPTVAVSQMFVKIFEIAPQYGLLNSLLVAVGLEHWVYAWLGNPTSAFWVLVTMDIWKHIGFYAILLYAGLVDISSEVIEAARIDGARRWRLVRLIIVPMIVPVLAASIVFSLNSTLKVFDSIMALTYGGPGTSTSPLTLYMHRVAFGYGEYGYGSAIAVALTVQCLVLSILVLAFSRRKAIQ
jgi:raffinose/stachyose/melibiose transport system permease protein